MSEEIEVDQLFAMPGHLVRRCHQISVGIFHEICKEYELTPIQFAVLWGIKSNSPIDQVKLSQFVGVDRTTIGNVILRLETRNLVNRHVDLKDRRVRVLSLTKQGELFLTQVLPSVDKVQDQLLEPLTNAEQEQFVRLLSKVVQLKNESSRAPTKPQYKVSP